jgi:D-glycero-D-manno-heptose 1,7-bisphosphate phosphatase
MANKAIFLDRDSTIMEDPGYVSDASAVKLLPGVELALKSLSQAGYKLVVVTNQSGIARGLFTEEALEDIHDELRRQLAERGAHLDGIYYCPYHPEGTVEAYAKDSDLRKPKPGMLLKAAKDLDLDLSASWMIGDGARDVEAGQRAGCRTIRVRHPHAHHPGEAEDEAAQADFTVRNVVDAARVVMRESLRSPTAPPREGGGAGPEPVGASTMPTPPPVPPPELPAPKEPERAEAKGETAPPDQGVRQLSDAEVRREILRYVRQLARAGAAEEFSFTKLFAGIVQVIAAIVLLNVVRYIITGAEASQAILWALVAVVLQVMALTLYIMQREK